MLIGSKFSIKTDADLGFVLIRYSLGLEMSDLYLVVIG